MRVGRKWAGAAVAACLAGLGACGETVIPGVDTSEATPCTPLPSSVVYPTLPDRLPPPATTTGMVPHQQINPDVFPDVIAEMRTRIFALPEVEERPSVIVDDATAIWLRSSFNLGRPECVIRGRELGHVHLDGSVHVTLPHDRIPGAESAGWIERHPWSDTNPGFEAYVMFFSPRDFNEVDVAVQLIADGIAFVDGG